MIQNNFGAALGNYSTCVCVCVCVCILSKILHFCLLMIDLKFANSQKSFKEKLGVSVKERGVILNPCCTLEWLEKFEIIKNAQLF